ncbi:MAG: molybdopterin-dependent oxidoreductase, partial [Acidobacteria bacterium]|nr:molybdopterin-dependent oxidoreductase [Acidobacteriota bacterium]
VEAYDVMTNKCPTGPNRGYGCQQIYFEQERMMDMAAEKLGMDPAEIRLRNFIPSDAFPYTTPSGGIYDSGDYEKGLKLALEMSHYAKLREEQKKARKEERLVGIGIAVGVDPSVSNMGYITVAASAEVRSQPQYLPKSGAAETATVKMDPQGGVTVLMNSTPQGQGHETVVAQIIADELGISPDDVVVVDAFDTSESPWSVSSGTYSSRFASVGTSAAVVAARKIKDKIFRIAGHTLKVKPEELELGQGNIFLREDPKVSVSLKRVAGTAHWDLERLPPGMEAGLEGRGVFNFPLAGAPDAQDRVNSSNTYGFMAEVMMVEVDRDSGQVKILKYISVHDAGTIINPKIVEGQIYGGALHGIAGALYEEFVYDEEGQFLTGSFMDYLVPTAAEAPTMEIGHICSPSPFTPLGSKGAGESSSETAPVLIANAVADALAPLGVSVTELPLNPKRVWTLIHERAGQKTTATK